MANVDTEIVARDGDKITLSEGAFTNEGIAELTIDQHEFPPNDPDHQWASAILTVESANKLYNALGELLSNWDMP